MGLRFRRAPLPETVGPLQTRKPVLGAGERECGIATLG
jgi:hypothetical protein